MGTDAGRVRAALDEAQDALLREGPVAALRRLGASPAAGAEPVVRRMHALVWNHAKDLPADLLAEPFLDPVWCQCGACRATWLVSPLAAVATPARSAETGLACASCRAALCPTCARARPAHCACGGSFAPLTRPNGRTRPAADPPASEEDPDPFPRSPERPAGGEDLHLYFGYEGRVPIGVDPTFPRVRTAAAADHVRWAELLLDAGAFPQARDQLDLLDPADARSARGLWLRARLELVRWRNAAERSRRNLDPEWDVLGEAPRRVREWLAAATAADPRFGSAWLLAAEIGLDVERGADPSAVVANARRARRLLGDTPAALLAHGRSLRRAGRAAVAAIELRAVPGGCPEAAEARRELWLAEREARCEADPPDIPTHLELGRWWLRRGEWARARPLFERLRRRCPDRPEGYYGLGVLAFVNADRVLPDPHPWAEAHQLAREALARGPGFGPAHELLGLVFETRSYRGQGTSVPAEDPLPYYRRAVELDPTCDGALLALAEDAVRRRDPDRALGLLERAAAAGSRRNMVYLMLAEFYIGRREFEKGAEAYRAAKELEPGLELSEDYKKKIRDLCGFEY